VCSSFHLVHDKPFLIRYPSQQGTHHGWYSQIGVSICYNVSSVDLTLLFQYSQLVKWSLHEQYPKICLPLCFNRSYYDCMFPSCCFATCLMAQPGSYRWISSVLLCMVDICFDKEPVGYCGYSNIQFGGCLGLYRHHYRGWDHPRVCLFPEVQGHRNRLVKRCCLCRCDHYHGSCVVLGKCHVDLSLLGC